MIHNAYRRETGRLLGIDIIVCKFSWIFCEWLPKKVWTIYDSLLEIGEIFLNWRRNIIILDDKGWLVITKYTSQIFRDFNCRIDLGECVVTAKNLLVIYLY